MKRKDKPICIRIEDEILLAFNIQRQKYHGGELSSGNCRILMRNAAAIMSSVSELLNELPPEQQRGSAEDIEQFCETLTRLLQHLDALTSIVYKTEDEITEEDKTKFDNHCMKLDRLWKRCDLGLPVKLHVLVQHMRDYLGNGRHTEEFMEQHHQVARSFNASFGGYSQGKKRKFNADMEGIRNDDKINEAKKEILGSWRQKKRRRVEEQQVRMENTEKERDYVLELDELDGYRSWIDILKASMESSYPYS